MRIFGLAPGLDGQVDIAAGVDFVIPKPDCLEEWRQQIFEMLLSFSGFLRLLNSAKQLSQRFYEGIKLLSLNRLLQKRFFDAVLYLP